VEDHKKTHKLNGEAFNFNFKMPLLVKINFDPIFREEYKESIVEMEKHLISR
jgi:hypothetical protein